MNNRRIIRREKRIKSYRRSILIIILLVVVALISIVGYAVTQMMQAADDSYHDLEREKSDLREGTVSIDDDPVSVLLMGVDDASVEEGIGRADALIVATFNPHLSTLKLVSIPRDTLVELAGRGTEDKINHAYSYGQEEMTIETVENFLEIPIDYYATVNFEAFKNMVDIFGGITVDVPFDFKEDSDDEEPELLQFEEGEMELDGRHALAYVRMRYEDPLGDLGRNERQQQVIEAMIDEMTSVRMLTKIDDIADEIGENVKTNLRIREGIGFVREYSDFSSVDIDKLLLETHPSWIDGVSYQIAEEESVKEIQEELQEHLEMVEREVE